MKNWFKRHKILLISFLSLSIILFLMIIIQVNIITKPDVLQDLNNYIETKDLTPALKKYVFMFFANLFLFAVWTILFMFIMWRIFFPTTNSLRDAFQIDSFQFLYNMPENIKKELKRDE